MDYFLKFADEAEAKSVLYRIEGAVEANEELGIEAVEGHEVANYSNIDVLGTIYTREVVEGEEPVARDGWHVNVRLVGNEDPAPLEPFSVIPTEPRRVWA